MRIKGWERYPLKSASSYRWKSRDGKYIIKMWKATRWKWKVEILKKWKKKESGGWWYKRLKERYFDTKEEAYKFAINYMKGRR